MDGGAADAAEVVADVVRLDGRLGAAAHGLVEGEVGVVDEERDVDDAVAVSADVLGGGMVVAQRRGDDEADLPLPQHVRGGVAVAGLEAGVGELRKAEGLAVEKSGLLGVARPQLDVVDPLEPEGVFPTPRLPDGDVGLDCGHWCCLRCGRKGIIARHA